jgi:hypothetical protein
MALYNRTMPGNNMDRQGQNGKLLTTVANQVATSLSNIVNPTTEGFESNSEKSIVGSLFLLLLLFVLSPGVLLTLPPGKGGIFRSGQTSLAAAFVHALLVVVIFNFI